MEVYVKLKKFLSEKRYLLKIKNCEMILEKTETTETQNPDESRVHIKYINILESNDKKKELTIERTDNGDKFKFLFETSDELSRLVTEIESEKNNYSSFIKDYYTANDSYNLIDGQSFFDYFKSVVSFITELEKSLSNVKMDENLEEILNIQTNFVNKINSYIQIINTNSNQLKFDNNDESTLLSRAKEIKTLLEELKEVIENCTHGLSSNDVKQYISTFKEEIIQKGKEIIMLIEEIKYNLANYLALKSLGSNENGYETFSSKEDEISKMLLENENLKIQIENLEIENDIIQQFLDINK